MSSIRGRRRLLAIVALGALAAGCSGGDDHARSTTTPAYRTAGAGEEPAPGQTADVGATTVARSPSGKVRLATLSSRAGLVTGGDTLVEIRVEGGGTPTLAVNDRAVTDLPAPDAQGRIRHLVTGLPATSTITAAVGDADGDRARLAVEDHPTDAPLFAGARLEPFVCKDETAGLAKATDVNCSAPTVVKWQYRSIDGSFKDLPNPHEVPADASVTVVDGHTVPYVVRDEQGVIDRSIYRLVALDPNPGDGPAPAWDRSGWNGRLVHRYGGGCGSTYSNNAGDAYNYSPLSNYLLSRGYAVVTSTLNTFQATCNPTLSAEVTARLREYFIEHYGVPDFVIGDGGSGGAIQQLQIALNYPGLLDAITPWASFPDALSISPGVTDCGLLMAMKGRPDAPALTDDQWTAVTGFGTYKTCEQWKILYLQGIDPTDGCDPALADQVYDPILRPKGVRCTNMDSNVAVYGRDPATGFARRPLDNTGIAYGRNALRAGTISVDQFLDVNERIGGYDIDGKPVPDRSKADDAALAAAYRSGGVAHEPGPLGDVPMIFVNEYADIDGDVHDSFRAFSTRQRLADAGLSVRNAVVWQGKRADISPEPAAVVVADEWLTKAAASPADRPWARRLEDNRPALAVDTCKLAKATVRGDHVYDDGSDCLKEMPRHADPRVAAGAPLRNDIMKCAHRPVDDQAVSDLGATFTPEQRARLARIFPDGLCDWSQPGLGIVPWAGPWQRY